MRHRHEDDIAKLAFGELSGPGAEQTRAIVESDPTAARLFASFKELAEGLKTLDVPQHQLSTDRLRHVILNRGLTSERGPGLLRWAWMPVAMGLFAFLLTQSLQRQEPLAGGRGTLDSTETIAERTAPTVDGPQVPTAIEASALPTRVASTSGRAPSGSPRIGRHVRDAAMGSRRAVDRIASTAAVEAALLKSADTMASAVVEAAVEEPSAPFHEDSEPIIIIGTDRDAETGAHRATEVSSASNVVIGG